ncbi:unnamed protein product [Ectocarpus sp. 12 AP-2014]
MKNVEEQKKKLEQKKNKLSIEETKLKLKERKARTRHLIENGGLIAKAGLDHLPSNALYGALLSLKEQINESQEIMAAWIVKGDADFNEEQQKFTPVILTFENQPDKEIRDQVRSLGLRWNKFRKEWYGTCTDLDVLNAVIKNQQHKLQILNNIN